jgi:uncharacterized damage-inducible protein DinB
MTYTGARKKIMTVETLFLDYAVEKLEQLMGRIEICLGMLSEEQVWSRGHENENAIGNLLLHLSGNIRQWIISSLGEFPDTRDRNSEFETQGGLTAVELAARLRDTLERAIRIVSGLTPEQLTRTYEIQTYRIAGINAVFHVVEHFSYHAGQIIFATKSFTGGDLGFYKHLKHAESIEQVP